MDIEEQQTCISVIYSYNGGCTIPKRIIVIHINLDACIKSWPFGELLYMGFALGISVVVVVEGGGCGMKFLKIKTQDGQVLVFKDANLEVIDTDSRAVVKNNSKTLAVVNGFLYWAYINEEEYNRAQK